MPTITDKAKRDLNIAFAKLLAMAGFTYGATDDVGQMGDIIQSGLNGLGSLASTDPNEGASLVGVEDADENFTATDVEGVLAEIFETSAAAAVTLTAVEKKANAALGIPVCVPVLLSKHSNGSVAARFTPGYAGKIRKITASVVDPVSTADKAATFTAAVAGVATTGGALALTSANCATVGAKVDGSAITAANAFTASQEITVAASSVTAFAEGQVVLYIFLDPAA